MNVASDNEFIVLVNSDDALVGVLSKIEAHHQWGTSRSANTTRVVFGRTLAAVIHGREKRSPRQSIGG
jgi:hypothetical protein